MLLIIDVVSMKLT